MAWLRKSGGLIGAKHRHGGLRSPFPAGELLSGTARLRNAFTAITGAGIRPRLLSPDQRTRCLYEQATRLALGQLAVDATAGNHLAGPAAAEAGTMAHGCGSPRSDRPAARPWNLSRCSRPAAALGPVASAISMIAGRNDRIRGCRISPTRGVSSPSLDPETSPEWGMKATFWSDSCPQWRRDTSGNQLCDSLIATETARDHDVAVDRGEVSRSGRAEGSSRNGAAMPAFAHRCPERWAGPRSGRSCRRPGARSAGRYGCAGRTRPPAAGPGTHRAGPPPSAPV